MNTTSEKTKRIVVYSLFTSLMVICSWIAIPTMIPVTLQTFAVFLAVLMLGARGSVISVTCYLLLGCIGLPVFAGFQAGVGILAGPLGGYMIGFIPSCLLSGALLKKKRSTAMSVLSLMAGLLLCYAIGTCWFVHVCFHEESLLVVLTTCVFPFIIPDAVKAWLAVILAEKVKKNIPE